MSKKLRIAVNAQIIPGSGSGGVETVLRGLTSFGKLDDDDEYVFVCHWDDDGEWLRPLLNERQTLVRASKPEILKPTLPEKIKRLSGPARPLARRLKGLFVEPPSRTELVLPASNGFFERLNCDVIHFPYQEFIRSKIPSVFNPHDLQHLHFPQYFAPEEIERREAVYPAACRASHTVVVASRFVKKDLIDNYNLEPDRIQVIPWAPETVVEKEPSDNDVRSILRKYGLPSSPFALYPAMTWEHKNHIRLLEAIALLRDHEQIRINLICTGHKNAFFATIEKRVKELRLEEQVMFLGVVAVDELNLLYRLAQFVVIPTLFEAASAPLFEAWQHGAPVACSSVTSLPEQAGDAALLFDPYSVDEIADAIKKMASDGDLRASFRERGFRRLRDFDWETMAKTYRAVYRRAAGVDPTEEDRHLLGQA